LPDVSRFVAVASSTRVPWRSSPTVVLEAGTGNLAIEVKQIERSKGGRRR
jgi:hypothetical protein